MHECDANCPMCELATGLFPCTTRTSTCTVMANGGQLHAVLSVIPLRLARGLLKNSYVVFSRATFLEQCMRKWQVLRYVAAQAKASRNVVRARLVEQ